MVLKRLLTRAAFWAVLLFTSQLNAVWVLPPVNVTNTPNVAGAVPKLAIDPQGNAVAVWQSTNATYSEPFSVYAAYYTLATNTWSTPVLLSTNLLPYEEAIGPKVGVDASGNAQAVWLQQTTYGSTTPHDVYTSTFTFATHTWSTPHSIFAAVPDFDAKDCEIAVAPNGKACAVWSADSVIPATPEIIYGSTYNGTSWAPYTNVSTNISPNNAQTPQVGVDANGKPFAIWTEDVPFPLAGNFVNSSQGTIGNVWAAAVPVSTVVNNQFNTRPSLAVDPSGNAKAIWDFSDGVIMMAVNGNSYISGLWQSVATIMSNISDTTFGPGANQVGVDAAGNGVAIWVWDNSSTINIMTSTSPAGSNIWTSPVTLSTFTSTDYSLTGVAVGVDSGGNASVVWNQPTGGGETGGPLTSIIYGSNYNFSTGLWAASPTQLSDPTHFPIALFPTVAGITAQGNPIAMWAADNDIDRANIQATTFSESFLPPTNFASTCGKNHFASQTVYSTTLTWSPSPSPGVVGYMIYQGTTLIATVPASGPFVFVVNNINRNETFTYSIVAFSASQQSVPVTITVPPGKNCKNKC